MRVSPSVKRRLLGTEMASTNPEDALPNFPGTKRSPWASAVGSAHDLIALEASLDPQTVSR